MKVQRSTGVWVGSTTVRLCGEGGVVQSPCVAAVHRNGTVLFGHEAAAALGREKDWRLLRPMRRGETADEELLTRYLCHLVRQYRPLFRGTVYLATAHDGENDPVYRSLLRAGVRTLHWVPAAAAAQRWAVGENTKGVGQLFIHIGGESTRCAVLCRGQVCAQTALPLGSGALEEAIAAYLRHRWGLAVGRSAAEQVKRELCGAERPRQVCTRVWGRNANTGLPQQITVTGQELTPVIRPVLTRLVQPAREVIAAASPELAGDLCVTGAVLWGGGAALPGLADFFSRELGIPAILSPFPAQAAVRGAVIPPQTNLFSVEG